LEARAGEQGTAADLPFRAVAVEQDSKSAPDCLGYKVNLGGRILSYTGDTVMCDGVHELARDADVLVIDCSCWQDPCPHHMSFEEVRRFRKGVPLSTTFVLTHLDAGSPPTVDIDGMIVAEDFATVRL
jgi:ribonuclease BN (tRNA processing enzyme)